MNNQGSSNFLKMKNKNIQEENDEDYIDIGLSKRKRNRKIEKFEKFKPKNLQIPKNEPSLKGAENKVKSILSSFLLTIESEDNQSNRKIKFLREKLSNKKTKFHLAVDKKSKKNLDIKSGSPLLLNPVHFGSNKSNNISSSISNNDDANTYKDINSSKKKLKVNNIKIKNSNLNLNKYFVDSISKSEITSSNQSINILKNSDIEKSSIISNEENINKNRKTDKPKLYLKKNSIKVSKKRLSLEQKISSMNTSNNIESSYGNSRSSLSIKGERRRSLAPKNLNNYNDPFFKSMNNIKSNQKNKKRIYKQISLQKDKLNILKKFTDKYNIDTKNEKKKKSFLNKNEKPNNDVESILKDLQEKIKNTIILRPEDLQFDDEIILKRRSKVAKEKNNINTLSKFSKKELGPFRKSQEYRYSKANLIDNNNKNESVKDNKKISEEKNRINNTNNKLKQPLKKSDLFKNTTSDILIQKNDSEISILKSRFQEDISSNLLPNMDFSSKTNINVKLLKEKFRIITHKNLVYDSLDDEEIEDEVNDYFYINPESKFSLIFDFIVLIVSIYSFIYFPYYLAHNLTFCRENFFNFNRIFNLFIELIYILDFIFGFFLAYYNFEEQLIKKHSSIIKKYLTHWFIFDLIGAIPVYSILKFKEKKCDSFMNAHFYNHILNNLNYLFLFNRILKFIKSIYYNQAFNYLSNILNDYHYFNQISLFIQIVFILSIFHFSSCIYIFIGRNSYPNWIFSTELEVKSFSDIYICGIYLLITALTTVRYGDITCYSFNERIFQLILLIVGIVAYSWIISYISNYVKKINEESIDFETRKAILDEIKLTNPNLTNNLYDRILRYLKYRKYHENKDKNIIFDCLPLALKNNLIAEMYKPIIKNFIFFKNFQNVDFIVRVVLSFRPILAIKNDILVNEGDFVEDIIFVKKGILAVELPLNKKNPEENREKYLNNPILQIKKNKNEKIGASTILSQRGFGIKSILNSSINNDNLKKINAEKAKQISYVKILNIRDNEHFGDVLMFLEQRSPLRVRVRSKKSELFFLRKIDAINISSSYQNIWRRINKKSVYNFKQIKKSIIKIVELYCSYKKVHTIDNLNKKRLRDKRRKSMFNIKIKKNSFELEPNDTIKRTNSQKDFKTYNNFNDYFDNNKNISFNSKIQSARTFSNYDKTQRTENTDSLLNIFDLENSNISATKNKNGINKNKSLFGGMKNNEKNNSKEIDNDNSNSISTPKKNSNFIKNKNNNDILMNAYKGNYKYYEMNKITNTKTIINEDPANEESFQRNSINLKNNLLNNNTINRLSQVSSNIGIISQNKIEEEEKENNEEKDEKDHKENSKKSESDLESKNDSCNGLEQFINKYIIVKKQKSENNIKSNLIKSKESSSSSFDGKNSNKVSNITPFKLYEINEEIYPGENLIISNKGENLLRKKISLSNIGQKHKLTDKNNYFKENSKLKFLLESIKDLNNYTDSNDSIRNNQNNNLTDIISKKNSKNFLLKMNKNIKNENNKFSIESNIKLEILSIYKNINELSNFEYYNNKPLQMKVKKLLEKKTKDNTISSNSDNDSNKSKDDNILNAQNTLNSINKISKTKTVSSIKSSTMNRRNSITNKSFIHKNNSNFLFSPKKNKFDNQKRKRKSVFIKSVKFINDGIDTEAIKPKKSLINKMNTSFNNSRLSNTSQSNLLRKSTHANRISKNLKNNLIKDNSKLLNINNLFVSNQKKKSVSLLSKINSNIEKTNQNLNNPDEFYSNYFQSLLEGEKKIKDKSDNKLFSIIEDNNIILAKSNKSNKLNRVKTKAPKNIFI